MRLRKTEWMWVAVIAGSIACFGNWLQDEMNRAALARSERSAPAAQDSRVFCAGLSVRESSMMDKGALWCGSVDVARSDPLGKD